VADADGREMFISAGCALELLMVAARRFGFAGAVALAPDPGDQDLAAAVSFIEGVATEFGEPLFESITRRHTFHGAFDGTPVARGTLDDLAAGCDDLDVALHWADETQRPQLDALVLRADALLFASPEYRQELGKLIGTGAFGNSWLISTLGHFAIAYLKPEGCFAEGDRRTLASSPALGVITAAGNTRADQVAAGQALARIYLLADLEGLVLQPVSQVLQHPHTLAALTGLLPGGRVPLQLFRIGRTQGRAQVTPRRSLEDMLG
jgi:hypothetical protein